MRLFKGKIAYAFGAALLLAAPLMPAAAQGVPDMASVDETPIPLVVPPPPSGELTEAAADMLKPGEYRWQPERAASGPMTMVISLSRQVGYVYRGGTLIGLTTVSSGKPGHETPVGTFTILQKQVDHRSTIYDGAPMPFMQRLTWDGIALHAGTLPGHPASHGCIRLPTGFAESLYRATALGMAVTVQDEDSYGPPIDMADAAAPAPDAKLLMAEYAVPESATAN